MNSWDCCRTCLNVNNLNPIFQISHLNEKYSDIIYKTTGLVVKCDDKLPQQMCVTCINTVNNNWSFRRKCQTSHHILLERLKHNQHHTIKTEHIELKSEISKNTYIDVHDPLNNDYIDNEPSNIVESLVNNVKNKEDDDSDVIVREMTVEDVLKKKSDFKIDNYVPQCSKKKYLDTKTNKSMECDSFEDTNYMFNDYNDDFNKSDEDEEDLKKVSEYLKKKEEENAVKTFVCEICHKSYKSKYSFVSHKKIHKMRVVCEHCGKQFIDRRRLLMHCKAKHGYQKTDKCSYCDYTGVSAESVKIHERTHTGEKPYVCEVCSASFNRKSSYLQHRAIHLPEKTVQCDLCPALFKSVTLMRIHKTRHKPREYKYKCLVCGSFFGKRWHCLRHIQRIHGVTDNLEGHLERVKLSDLEK